jgi:hypothetical protein
VNKYSIFALALLAFAGMAVVAHAQEEGQVVVSVPFDFFAGTKMLPAGEYTVSRSSSDTNSPLIIYGNSNSALVLPVAFDDVPADTLRLNFDHVGGAYLLSEVKTQIGTYSIGTSREAATLTRLAQAKMGGMTSSGTP